MKAKNFSADCIKLSYLIVISLLAFIMVLPAHASLSGPFDQVELSMGQLEELRAKVMDVIDDQYDSVVVFIISNPDWIDREEDMGKAVR